jgi:hypothetical protein
LSQGRTSEQHSELHGIARCQGQFDGPRPFPDHYWRFNHESPLSMSAGIGHDAFLDSLSDAHLHNVGAALPWMDTETNKLTTMSLEGLDKESVQC